MQQNIHVDMRHKAQHMYCSFGPQACTQSIYQLKTHIILHQKIHTANHHPTSWPTKNKDQ